MKKSLCSINISENENEIIEMKRESEMKWEMKAANLQWKCRRNNI